LDTEPNGVFGIQVRAENDQGTDGVSFPVTVNADQPPTAFILQPLDRSTISGSNAEFYGGSTDDYATYKGEFYIDGQLAYTDANREDHYHLNGAHISSTLPVLATASIR
jgi:hypothetical protein